MHTTQPRLFRSLVPNTAPNTVPTLRPAPRRPVPEMLLELAYHLHVSRVVTRPAEANLRPCAAVPKDA
jgi:hypothetical protein